jgi:hypothetical protein
MKTSNPTYQLLRKQSLIVILFDLPTRLIGSKKRTRACCVGDFVYDEISMQMGSFPQVQTSNNICISLSVKSTLFMQLINLLNSYHSMISTTSLSIQNP